MNDMKLLVRCKTGHIFRLQDARIFTTTTASDGHPVYAPQCPHCESAYLKEVPVAVIQAVTAKFEPLGLAHVMLESLQYDSLNGCYFFTYAGMYHGVEEDGYIHT